ncbi:MAG: RNA polymerase sigma factor [Bacteroidales bacterium]|nr:RNA polymerase sigma factor [Bacteroidales bacterium]
MDQKVIIKGIKRGDRDVFRLLMEENIESVYRIIFKIVPIEDEARDIVQETFIRVWEKRGNIKSEKCIMPWIKRIAINRCYDYLRWQKRNNRKRPLDNYLDSEKFESDITTDSSINAEEFRDLILRLTCNLSPKQKLVFTLSEIEEMSHDEISSLTGLPKASVKSNLRHARKKVGEYLEKMKYNG